MLRMRYIIAVVLLAAFIVTLISVYREVRSTTIIEHNTQQMLLARQAAIGIEREFAQHYRVLAHFASFPEISDFDPAGIELLEQFYERYQDSISAVTRTSEAGIILHTIPFNEQSIGADISYQEHVKQILDSHEPVISEVFLAVQGYQAVAYHVPVFRQDQFAGTIAILIPFANLAHEHLESIRPSANGFPWVISQQGVELYCPEQTCIGSKAFDSFEGSPSLLATAGQMMRGQTGITAYSTDHPGLVTTESVTFHGAYYPIQLGNTHWSILVSSPEGEVLATMEGFKNRLLLIALLLITVSLVYTFYVVRAVLAAREQVLQQTAEVEKADLTKRYQQAQKMEAVGRLAAGVAHDLNNMLTPVLGYCELLIDDLPQGSEHQEYLQQIQRASLRARDLVQQLLAFGRKQTLAIQLIDLNHVVMHIDQLLRRTIRENIQIEITLQAEQATIRGDVGSIEQAILNLAINAQDAMPSGGRLMIATECVELDQALAAQQGVEPGPHVLLAIGDTGHGIDKEMQDKVFDPFFTTKEHGKGTGLGLASVHGIVLQHGGAILLNSEPGQGTQINLYFPLVEGKSVTEPAGNGQVEHLPAKGNILIVEDDPMVRKLTLDVLSKQGYTVHAADNGRTALELIESLPDRLQLVLTDVVMPEMTGKELVDCLHEHYPGIKVLYMSGHEDSVISDHGALDPGVPFISKPFTVNAIREKVSELLET